MTLDTLLFVGVLLCYLLASIGYTAYVFGDNAGARRAAPALLVAGLLLHTGTLAEPWFNPAAPPLPAAARVVLTIAWLIALIQALLDRRQGWAALGSLSLPLAFLAVFYAYLLARGAGVGQGAVHNPLMSAHLTATILGFAGFALSFCMAVVYLGQSRMLQRHQLRAVFRRLPPLESIARVAHAMAAIGLTMLTLGIVTGALLFNERGVQGWYFQARVVLSLFAWLVYAAYLAASTLGGWRGRKTAYFLLAGFALVLAAYLVNLL